MSDDDRDAFGLGVQIGVLVALSVYGSIPAIVTALAVFGVI